MNQMTVNPLLMISPDGPIASQSGELIHLRQGDLDGACGPYCMVMTLIAMGLMRRVEAQNMHTWDARTREGKFRDGLQKFGTLSRNGTFGYDLVELTDYFKYKGLRAVHLEGTKKQIFQGVTNAIDQGHFPIVGVDWQGEGGNGHWILAVGYQGVATEGMSQMTHLLCLDPGQETPKTSLWNAVLSVFNSDGTSIKKGRMPSSHWGMDSTESGCHIVDTVILSLEETQ